MPSKREPTYLITTSILDSFNWLNNCPPSWRDRAYASIVSSIRREPWDPHPTAQRGMDFEAHIYSHAKLKNSESGSRQFQTIVDKCRGGKFQKVLKKNVTVQGLSVVLYGKADVMFDDRILDIKTTENYRGASKYLDGWQHILYLYMTGLKAFSYLIVLFEAFPSMKIVDKYETPFLIDNPEELWPDIEEGIIDLHDWLEDEGLWSDYEQTFSNNSRR